MSELSKQKINENLKLHDTGLKNFNFDCFFLLQSIAMSNFVNALNYTLSSITHISLSKKRTVLTCRRPDKGNKEVDHAP